MDNKNFILEIFGIDPKWRDMRVGFTIILDDVESGTLSLKEAKNFAENYIEKLGIKEGVARVTFCDNRKKFIKTSVNDTKDLEKFTYDQLIKLAQEGKLKVVWDEKEK